MCVVCLGAYVHMYGYLCVCVHVCVCVYVAGIALGVMASKGVDAQSHLSLWPRRHPVSQDTLPHR